MIRRVVLPSGLRVAVLDVAARGSMRGAPPTPPLVLLHGVGADKGEWALTAPLLSRGRRLLAPDLLGHGGTDKPAGAVDYRIRLLADVVVEALEQIEGLSRPVDLLGHSLGGAVALDVVRRFPRLVRRLVLVDAAGPPPREALDPLAASLSFAPANFAESCRLLATSVDSRWLSHPLVALAAALYKGRRRNRPQLLKLLAAVAAGEDALRPVDLGRIAHPTLVLWGDRDRIFPLATGRRLAAALPHARLEILPRCGHVPPTERPLAFVRRVETFLSGS